MHSKSYTYSSSILFVSRQNLADDLTKIYIRIFVKS